MIVLFSDFGVNGPYIGQIKAVLAQELGDYPVIDLFSDAPTHDPKASSYLLAAFCRDLPQGAVIVAVVDPGVGSDQREGVVVEADGKFYVGPGNGLFTALCHQAGSTKVSKIAWSPDNVSVSFHGRDVFAPIAAKIVADKLGSHDLFPLERPMPSLGPADLAEVVYVDHFGNLMTGLRGQVVNHNQVITLNNLDIYYAITFSSVPKGTGFWYVNSSGLIEIAVNYGRADEYFGATIGCSVKIQGRK